MIDLDLQPLNHSLLHSDIAHGANLVSKQGMYYHREGEHHLVFQLHYLRSCDEESATTTLSEEFIERE